MKENLLEAKAIVSKNLDVFVEKFLSELETEKKCKKRKTIARKVLMVFLGNYSSLVEGETKTDCKEIMYHFSNSISNAEENENLNLAIQQLVEYMIPAMKMVENKEIVVRPIIYNGVKTLMVVDYRYNLEKKEQLTYIVEAAKKLAKANKHGMTFILTSDKNMYKKYKDSVLVRKRPGDFVIPKKSLNLNINDNIIATSADSDGDYHRWFAIFIIIILTKSN